MAIVGKAIESTQLDFVNGSPTSVNFRFGDVSTAVSRIVITTTADVYLNFDGDADDTSFVFTPGCGTFSIDNISFTTLSAQAVTGGGTLYILAMRG